MPWLDLFFFFSSRRRHTIWPRDWSSDVCSSDLQSAGGGRLRAAPLRLHAAQRARQRTCQVPLWCRARQIGRASCRERVYVMVIKVTLTKKESNKETVQKNIRGILITMKI